MKMEDTYKLFEHYFDFVVKFHWSDCISEIDIETAMIVYIDLNPSAPKKKTISIIWNNPNDMWLITKFFSTYRFISHGRWSIAMCVISATIRLWQTERYFVKFQYFSGFLMIVDFFYFFFSQLKVFQAEKQQNQYAMMLMCVLYRCV